MPQYFAYGSNMCQQRLIDRIGSFTVVGIAVLGGHDLKFNKRSADGSGKANIVIDSTKQVEGIVFAVTPDQLRTLDGKEPGYHRENVQVILGGHAEECVTYVANDDRIADGLQPSHDYLDLIRCGAAHFQLSDEYQRQLASEPCDDLFAV